MVINGHRKSGILQGSVLGPLLLVYIEICRWHKFTIKLIQWSI